MKKVLIVLLASFLLFSCSVDQITNVMGKMGQNVMGDYVNTEAAKNAQESVTKAEKQTVGPKDSSNNTSIGFTRKDKDGNDETVSITVNLGDKEVSSILTGFDKEKDKDLINSILDSTVNSGSSQHLIDTLKEPVKDTDTIEAAKGTATVLASVLNDVKSLPETSGLNKDAANAIDTLAKNLNSLSEEGHEVSAADVIALRAVTTLVNEIANNATVDPDGSITGIDSSNTADLVSSSLEAVSIIQAVNPTSIISADDLEDLIVAFTKGEERSLVDDKTATAIRNLYSIYTKLFGKEGIDAKKVSVMSLYSSSVDMYVSLVPTTGEGENAVKDLSGEVADLNRVVQYFASSFFSTAEYKYKDIAGKVFENPPESLAAYIDAVVEKNPWIADKNEAVKEFVDIDVEYKDSPNTDYKAIVNDILKEMKSTGTTLEFICKKFNLPVGDELLKFFNKGI